MEMPDFRMNPYSNEEFGKLIKAIRMTSNLSQREMAKRLEIAAPYLSRIEHGHTNVSLSVADRLLNRVSHPILIDVPVNSVGSPFEVHVSSPRDDDVHL
jgi:transcriptional regulator with XRE-family HTH domain